MILGTIGTYTAGSGVTLTIDGETTPTTKDYKFLSSYSPSAGDRVLIEEIGGSYVVLGKLINSSANDGVVARGCSSQDYADRFEIRFNTTGANIQANVWDYRYNRYLFSSWKVIAS